MIRTKVMTGAMSLLMVAGFAQATKVGKITAITLDTETNQSSVTVTLGELQLPQQDAKTGKLEIVALGSETVSFVLSDELTLEQYNPFRGTQPAEASAADDGQTASADDAAVAEEATDADNSDVATENAATRQRSRRSPAADGTRQPPMSKETLRNKVALGRTVQLVYAEDGTTVQCVQFVADLPQTPIQPCCNGLLPRLPQRAR